MGRVVREVSPSRRQWEQTRQDKAKLSSVQRPHSRYFLDIEIGAQVCFQNSVLEEHYCFLIFQEMPVFYSLKKQFGALEVTQALEEVINFISVSTNLIKVLKISQCQFPRRCIKNEKLDFRYLKGDPPETEHSLILSKFPDT